MNARFRGRFELYPLPARRAACGRRKGNGKLRTAALRRPNKERATMTKVIGIFLAGLMLIQLIRPLGLPGLRRRADAWKLAVAGLFGMLLVLSLGAG